MSRFEVPEFQAYNRLEKFLKVNEALYALLLQHAKREFLLSEVIHFISEITERKIIEKYTLSDFETWLMQFSGLEADKQTEARALIVGKWIPREEYQTFFPIGMGKKYPGPHFVTAHSSPDLDTLVSSFWGWMDAFAAEIGTGVHIWNVPGGAPKGSVEADLLFMQTLGPGLFDALAKTRSSLTVTSFDLMTQENMIKRYPTDFMLSIDQERNHYAVVLIDDRGRYLGDWRHFDVEGVRQVIMSFNTLIRWLERQLHKRLIALFSQETLQRQEIEALSKLTFEDRLRDLHSIKEYTYRQVEHLDLFLKAVFQVEEGIESSFGAFTKRLEALDIVSFDPFRDAMAALAHSSLFDKEGRFVENRPLLFRYFEKIFTKLGESSRTLRTYVEQLKIALDIKTHVFGYTPQFLSHRTEIQEIRSKMTTYPYLTVTVSDSDGSLYPLGVIHAKDLRRPALGTVTLRDFSNKEETKVPDYLAVISVIDHHKTSMTTETPPMVLICDAQSSNALVGRLAMEIYSRYSTGGLSEAKIQREIQMLRKQALTAKAMRLLTRLYNHKAALDTMRATPYFVNKDREMLEYLHYIHAILDDTDLLTKVSRRDVDAVRDLLNRMESLKQGQVLEVIDFDDIAKDADYVNKAARKLLANEALYKLYKNLYIVKEKAVDEHLLRCSEGKPSSIFDDVKVQNGCVRVSQTKIFAKNTRLFKKLAEPLRITWVRLSHAFHKEHPEIDLYMHMCSTIASSEELHQGGGIHYKHRDELWIWIPFTDMSIEHLKVFLSAFKSSPAALNNQFELFLFGPKASELSTIFQESFLPVPHTVNAQHAHTKETFAVITYQPGTLNSRKAQVSPYLPRIRENNH